MEVPAFAPAPDRSLAAVVSVPDASVRGSPIVWLPGGNNPRTRNTIGRDAARRVAAVGRPVMRLDYPGCGLSGGPRVRDGDGLVDLLNGACEWFRELCGAPSFTVGGTCRGARLGVSLAALNPRIDHVVAVSCPVGAHRRPRRRRIRAGVAALDPVGARMTSVLTREIRWRNERFELMPGVVEDIVNASHSRLTFIYGTEDESFAAFTAMMEAGELPPQVADRIEVTSREGVQLYGFTKLDDMEWMTDTLAKLFSEAVPEVSVE